MNEDDLRAFQWRQTWCRLMTRPDHPMCRHVFIPSGVTEQPEVPAAWQSTLDDIRGLPE